MATCSFSDVFFIDATTAQTLTQDLKSISQSKRCGESPQDALTWLVGHHSNWLLLFNNADDTSLALHEYFPPCSHGNNIITSQNRELCNLAPQSNYQVMGMNSNDATHLLLVMAKQELSNEVQESAEKIAKVC